MPGQSASPGSQLDAVLDRRTADLARPAVADTREPGLAVIGFTCSGGLYGLPMTQVSEVLPGRRPVRWPGAPAVVLGLVGQAGRTIAVLDLGRLLGTTSGGSEPGMLVVLRANERRLALAVERATGMLRVDPLPAGEDGPLRWAAIRDAAPDAPQTLALLDAERLAALVTGSDSDIAAPPGSSSGPSLSPAGA